MPTINNSLIMMIVLLVNYRKYAVFLYRFQCTEKWHTFYNVKVKIRSESQIFRSEISKNKVKNDHPNHKLNFQQV